MRQHLINLLLVILPIFTLRPTSSGQRFVRNSFGWTCKCGGVLGLSLSAPTGPLPLLSSEELNFVETKLFLLTYVSS